MTSRGILIVSLGLVLVGQSLPRAHADPPASASASAPARAPASGNAAEPPAPATTALDAEQPDVAPSPPERPLAALPLDKGLPVIVRAGLFYVDVDSVDENAEAYTGTVDLRLEWEDPRLRYPPDQAPIGFKEFRGELAEARLAEIWSPDVELSNLTGEPTYRAVGLRMYPDGRVELLQRTSGQFAIVLDIERFPFDRQSLTIDLVSRRENTDKMLFDFRQEDLDFSRVDSGVRIHGWDVGLVDLARDPLSGWHGESYSRLRASLEVRRRAGETVPSLFIPLFASLLIPLLATWLNKMRDAEFQVEAFELTNIVIGGLFAVIALNFTVNSDRSILATGNNTVAWLFGLNYLTLAMSLLVNVALFRFDVVRRFFGKYVQEQVFLYVSWALPVLVGATALGLMLIAAV